MRNYSREWEGQVDFYNDYLQVVDGTLKIEDVLSDGNDGVVNGNILEFKTSISDLNYVLLQAIKYQSRRRVKGKPVPATMILVSLNEGVAYCYKSEEYLSEIEKVYLGASSKNNEGFAGGRPFAELHYADDKLDEQKLIALLRERNFIKIHIDENCIVGWAKTYYAQNPSARKADFIGDTKSKVKIIGEIREPRVFEKYIYPYEGETNAKFQYLMDKLNDDIQKKNLGAFYTPMPYAQKSLELVRRAIARAPQGNDYIILDRCAGTGNLEKLMTDEELSHTILSTVEYYEYKVLLEVLGDKVRTIIPPTETTETFNMGLVTGADALSEEYVNNPVIRQHVDNPKCTIILFENPPYTEPQAVEGQKSAPWKNSYVVKQMRKEVKGTVSNELGNAFIWSAFKYYLRQPTDSYVVYSPCKYWKAQHLVNKKFIDGFAFNRRHFHTKIDACIACVLWANVDDNKTEEFCLHGIDLAKDNSFVVSEKLAIKKIHTLYSERYNDNRKFEGDTDGITLGLDGLESENEPRIKSVFNSNMLGYMIVGSSGFDKPDLESSLLVAGCYRGNGFFVRKDNYLEKLPMFAASRYITYNRAWTERSRIMKSADGADRFFKDVQNGKLSQFLLKCLLFTVFETQNHFRSFKGSDGRFYRNELCLDTTNGETIASRDLQNLELNEREKEMLAVWNLILESAKQTKRYDNALTYGVYQIIKELDTVHNDDKGKKIPDYPELHGHLATLKTKLKAYYNKEIVPVLFEYELLK